MKEMDIEKENKFSGDDEDVNENNNVQSKKKKKKNKQLFEKVIHAMTDELAAVELPSNEKLVEEKAFGYFQMLIGTNWAHLRDFLREKLNIKERRDIIRRKCGEVTSTFEDFKAKQYVLNELLKKSNLNVVQIFCKQFGLFCKTNSSPNPYKSSPNSTTSKDYSECVLENPAMYQDNIDEAEKVHSLSFPDNESFKPEESLLESNCSMDSVSPIYKKSNKSRKVICSSESEEEDEIDHLSSDQGLDTVDSIDEDDLSVISLNLGVSKEIQKNYVLPKQFQIKIPAERFWKVCAVKIDDKTLLKSYEFQKGWPAIVDEGFENAGIPCVFKALKTAYVAKTEKKGFARMEGRCGCEVEFRVIIENKPIENEPAIGTVTSTGVFKLKQDKNCGRPISGALRKKYEEILKTKSAHKVYLENEENSFGSLRTIHISSLLRNAAVARKINSERLQKERSHLNPADEVVSLMDKLKEAINPNSSIPGYIHQCNTTTGQINIHLYEFGTLRLHAGQLRKGLVTIHVDATGRLFRRPPGKRTLIYQILGKRQMDQNDPKSTVTWPLAEMVSQSGTVVSISTFFGAINYSMETVSPRLRTQTIADLAICDCSFAILHSLLKELNRESMVDYVNRSYKLFTGKGRWPKWKCAVFICTSHLIKACRDKISAIKTANKNITELALFAVARFEECNSYRDFQNVSTAFIQTFGMKRINEDVSSANIAMLQDLKQDKDILEEKEVESNSDSETEEESDTELNDDNRRLRTASKFRRDFLEIREDVLSSENSNDPVNSNYCIEVVNYVQNHKMTIFPLWNAAVVRRTRDQSFIRETNAVIESWFRKQKNTIDCAKHLPYSDYIRENKKYHFGEIMVATKALHVPIKSKYRKNRKIRPEDSFRAEETWGESQGRTKSQDRSAKYFSRKNPEKKEVTDMSNQSKFFRSSTKTNSTASLNISKLQKTKAENIAVKKSEFSNLNESVTDNISEAQQENGVTITTEKVHVSSPGTKFIDMEDVDEFLASVRIIPLFCGPSFLKNKRVKLSNTCNFDCSIFILYCLEAFTSRGNNFILNKITTQQKGESVWKLLAAYNEGKFALVKSIWVEDILKLNASVEGEIDLFGSEFENGIGALRDWFPLILHEECSSLNCKSPVSEKRVSTYDPDLVITGIMDFKKKMEGVEMNTCQYCSSRGNKTRSKSFTLPQGENNDLLAFTCLSSWTKGWQNESSLPEVFELFGFYYRIAAYTVNEGIHFVAVICIGKKKFTYDGKYPRQLEPRLALPNYKVSTIFLLKVEDPVDGSSGLANDARSQATTFVNSPQDIHEITLISFGLVGLLNENATTCFGNAVVQCLSNTKPLLEYLLNLDYVADVNTETSKMKGELIHEFARLILNIWKASNAVDPTEFMKKFKVAAGGLFELDSQQDAQEFGTLLLDGLHDDLNRISLPKRRLDDHDIPARNANDGWMRFLRQNDSKIVELFYGQLQSTLSCQTCLSTKSKYDEFQNIFLEIPAENTFVDLHDCFRKFCNGEVVSDVDCDTCKKKTTETQLIKVESFPKVLIVNIKRFDFSSFFGKKIGKEVRYPIENLDLSPYSTKPSEEMTYNLYAVVQHLGGTSNGHYIAYCKHPYSGQWNCFNDSFVRPFILDLEKEPEGYVLFYEKN